MATRRGRDIRLIYTKDNDEDIIIVQRTYRINDTLAHPITPLLLAREVTGVPYGVKSITPRRCVACIPNSFNVTGQSIFNTVLPYKPGDPNLTNQLREIESFSADEFKVEHIDYEGESSI